LLSVEVGARIGQLPLRGGKRRFCRAQLVEFVLRVELGQDLARRDPVADIDWSFDHSPADAKGKRRLVFRPDVPRQHHSPPALSPRLAVAVRSGRTWGAAALKCAFQAAKAAATSRKNAQLQKDFYLPMPTYSSRGFDLELIPANFPVPRQDQRGDSHPTTNAS